MARRLETISLLLLISVVTIRPLVAESYDSSTSGITEALGDVADPSPVRSLTFDLLILASGCLWFTSRSLAPAKNLRRSRLELVIPLWLLAATLSCLAAGNKRLAINASLDWLCLLLVPMLLAQLLTRPHHRLVLFAAVIASATAQTYACFDQYFISFHDTWRHYEANKAEFWARQNVAPDSEKVILFENRILAREAQGSLPHPNVTGAYLMLCLIPLAGWIYVGLFKNRRRDSSREPSLNRPSVNSMIRGDSANLCFYLPASVLAVLIGTAALLTKSRGAWLAAVAGIVFLAAWRWARSRASAPLRMILYSGLGATCAAAIAILAYITYVGTRFTATLLFRWQYWRASARLIRDHFFFGVGRENFGRHYLAYKPIDSPEEISTPHNFIIQIAADFGILGVVAAALTVVAIILELRWQTTSREPLQLIQYSDPPGSGIRSFMAWGAVLAALVIVSRLVLSDASHPGFVYYTTMTTVIAWATGYAGVAFLAAPLLRTQVESHPRDMDRARRRPNEHPYSLDASDHDACANMYGPIILSIFVFLINETINFALFIPGAAITCFALLAIPLAPRFQTPTVPDNEHPRDSALIRELRQPRAAAMLAWLAFLIIAAFVVLPVIRSSRHLRLADRVAHQSQPFGVRAGLVTHHLTLAGIVDPLDPTPFERLAEWKLVESTVSDLPMEPLLAAELAVREAIQRDPHHLRPRRLLIRILRGMAEVTGAADDYRKAGEAAAAAITLYPSDPGGYVTLADAQAARFAATGAVADAGNAIANYRHALELDEQRWTGETIRRFNDRRKSEIREQIFELQQRAARSND